MTTATVAVAREASKFAVRWPFFATVIACFAIIGGTVYFTTRAWSDKIAPAQGSGVTRETFDREIRLLTDSLGEIKNMIRTEHDERDRADAALRVSVERLTDHLLRRGEGGK
jgi:hypothetical protein